MFALPFFNPPGGCGKKHLVLVLGCLPYWQKERSVLWVSSLPLTGASISVVWWAVAWAITSHSPARENGCLPWTLLDNQSPPPYPPLHNCTALPTWEAWVREAKRTAAGVCLVKLPLPHFSQPRWEGRFTDWYLYPGSSNLVGTVKPVCRKDCTLKVPMCIGTGKVHT